MTDEQNQDQEQQPTPPPSNEALLIEGMTFLDSALAHFLRVDNDPRARALSNLTHGLISLGTFTLLDLFKNGHQPKNDGQPK